MRKKVYALSLLTALALSLVACGKDGDSETTAAATTTEAATTEAATTEAAAAAGEEKELEMMHGMYKIKYDASAYRPATDDDMFGDLIPLDDTKYGKIYVTSLSGEDFMKEKMDVLKEAMGSDPEELTIDGHKAYIYKSQDDLLGYSYDCVIPYNGTLKSADGYYNQENAVYIYAYGDKEEMVYNDVVLNIMKSVDIDESLEDAAEAAVTEEQAKADAAGEELGYGKSNKDATGNCTLEVLQETYKWQKEAGFDMTYEEFVEHFGCDGAPWYEGAFDEERHAYKWQTEDGSDFLYVTFAVNADGSETYKSCTYSTAVKGE